MNGEHPKLLSCPFSDGLSCDFQSCLLAPTACTNRCAYEVNIWSKYRQESVQNYKHSSIKVMGRRAALRARRILSASHKPPSCPPKPLCSQEGLLFCGCAMSLQSCLTLCDHGLQPTRLLCPWDSPGKSTGVGSHFLLQQLSCPLINHRFNFACFELHIKETPSVFFLLNIIL